MQISKWGFLAALNIFSLAIMGCNLPEPTNSERVGSLSATFTAEAKADQSKVVEGAAQGAFNLPDSKTFNLQACIKDSAYGKIVTGHEFTIKESGKTFTTNKSGCLTWPEEIKFNFLAESQYVRIERTIVGTGIHRGEQVVAFAVNPWSHGETLAPVLNPDDGNNIPHLVQESDLVSAALKGMNQDTSETRSRRLWVDDGRFFVTEQQIKEDGITLLVELRPNIAIQMSKMNGEIFLRPLTSGKFTAQLSIIHVYQHDGKEIRRKMAESKSLDIIMSNGSLSIQSPLTLNAIPTRGQVYVGLKLQPVEGPVGLKEFHGLYLMGDFDSFKGVFLTKLASTAAQNTNFQLDDYINSDAKDLSVTEDKKQISDDVYQKPRIEVAQLDFKWVRIGKESTQTREVVYNVKACVRNGIDQKYARAHTFKVTKFRENTNQPAKTIEVKTDNNSCINWDESVTVNYFECQHYIKGFVNIENADYGMNQQLDMIVNPWENSASFARDMRYVDLSEKVLLTCENESKPKTQIQMDSYSYNALSYNYTVDNNLTLWMHKKIQFRLEPKLLTYSSLQNGRMDSEKLRDGIYLLKIAIVQNPDYDQRSTYVTNANRFVTVINGTINTDITLSTSDLKALGARNQLLVEVHPIDEAKVVVKDREILLKTAGTYDSVIDKTSPLENPTFIGPITLNNDEATRPLRIMDRTAITSYLKDGQGTLNNTSKNIIATVQAQGKKDLQRTLKNLTDIKGKQFIATRNNLAILDLHTADEEAPLNMAFTNNKTSLPSNFWITKKDLKDMMKTGKLNSNITHKLCAFWANDFAANVYKDKGGVFSPRAHLPFGSDCLMAIRKDPSAFFILQKELLVKEVGGSKLYKGLNQGITVGTSFSLSNSYSESFSRSKNLSARAGLSQKFFEVFSVGVDASYSLSWSKSDSKNSGNSVSVNGNVSLNVQQNIFQVRVNKSEQCMILKLNPNIFIGKDGWFAHKGYKNNFNAKLSEQEKTLFKTRGFLICDGIENTEPQTIAESYFLINQETSSSQMQDNGDNRNRPFFIALRSVKDYASFLTAIKAQTTMPTSTGAKMGDEGPTTDMLVELFKAPLPAYPGMFHN